MSQPGRSELAALTAIALVLLLFPAATGCATAPTPIFEAKGSGWQTRQGQAVWRPRRGAAGIAGELLLLSHPDGGFFLEFSKPPLTIVTAWRSGCRWHIEFPARPRRLQGTGAVTRRVLWGWLAPALEGRALPAGMTFHRNQDGWRLSCDRTGESLEGYLGP